MQNISYKMQNKNILKNQYYFQEKSSKGLPNTTFLKKSSAGFTLVEVLVAIIIFITVMTLATGLFVYSLENHKKSLVYQEIFSQASFAMEYMIRGIRMAKKQKTNTEPIKCFHNDFIGHNYQLTPDAPDRLKFIKWSYFALIEDEDYGSFVCYEFFKEWDSVNEIYRLMKRKGSSLPVPLTSTRLNVKSLNFLVQGDLTDDPTHQYQPKVTIVLEIEARNYFSGRKPRVHLQTTVSQRDIDFPL